MRSIILVACVITLVGVSWAVAQPLVDDEQVEGDSLFVRPEPHRVAHESMYPTLIGQPNGNCSFNNVSGTCQSGHCNGTTVPNHCSGHKTCCIEQNTPKAGCGSHAVERAMTWVRMKLQYCQSPNNKPDYDPSCSKVCRRLSNPKWDGYRSDCSGLVSYAYGLPPPGRVTSEFAPLHTDISFTIKASELRKGDILNSVPDEHVMIFRRWLNDAHTEVELLEEPGCAANPPHARITQTSVTYEGSLMHLACNGLSFQPVRFKSNSKPC